MNKLIVFDVDGTIMDSISFYAYVRAEYSRMNGLQQPCARSVLQGYHDPDNHDFKWGIPIHEQNFHLQRAFQMADEWEACDVRSHHIKMYDGAYDVMADLKAWGYTLALVTTKNEKPLKKTMARHKLDSLVSGYRSMEDSIRGRGALKPAPDLLNCVMRQLNFAPEDTVMIGDTTMDIEMGLNAGTHTIAVTWGAHDKEKMIQCGAHYIADHHFSNIVPIIKDLFEETQKRVANLF